MNETAPTRSEILAPGGGARGVPLALAVLIGVVGALALSFPRAWSVWRTGAFFDSDDAMRAVELRDFLAGQPWFDLTAHRVDPPQGLPMHWSRFVDAPLAGLRLFFGLLLVPDLAERATRLVFPLALLAALMALVAWTASLLGGGKARNPAVWLTFLSGAVFLQFTPGRIDHHAPQIVLLTAAVGFFLRGLDPARAPSMALAAAAMAASLAVSLENMPFFAVLIGALPMLFVVDGGKFRAQLGWFALGALIAFPACYAATVAPARYLVSACDAYSAVHLAAILIGALCLALLALAASWFEAPRRRVVAAGAAGAAVVASALAVAPACLGDPLGGLDPLLRDLWLAHVAEAKPLSAVFATSPNVAIATGLPIALGFAAALFGALAQPGLARRRWLVVAGAIAAGFAAGLLHVRVFSSATPLAMAPLAVMAVAVSERFAGSLGAPLRAALVGVLCLAVSPMGVALALPAQEGAARQGPDLSCLEPAMLAPLAALAPARVVAPVDMGAHLLAHTPHSVFAAPYHRDNHGNRIAVDAFLAPPDEAERILRRAGAEFVLWCAGGKGPSALIRRAPDGLAATLARGETPPWLRPIRLAGTPFLVFAVTPGK